MAKAIALSDSGWRIEGVDCWRPDDSWGQWATGVQGKSLDERQTIDKSGKPDLEDWKRCGLPK
jgi:hypothetical protein